MFKKCLPKIPSNKKQNTNELQTSSLNDQILTSVGHLFEIWFIDYCNLFVIYYLRFGICIIPIRGFPVTVFSIS
jgi:hypothetical protein